MARPAKARITCPGLRSYCFRGGCDIQPVEIQLDELESLRLCDLEECSQLEAANAMNISRGTLQRLLYSAHKKLAFALLFGRTIRTEGATGTERCPKSGCRFCSNDCDLEKTMKGRTKMKIAITCENNRVFQHFGHTPEFAVYTVEDGKVLSKETLDCGGTGHGALAELLRRNDIDILICGGIGGGAQMALAEAGIKLIGGASGDTDEVIAAFAAGQLNVNPDFQCRHHDHGTGHRCGDHGCGGPDREFGPSRGGCRH